MVYCLLDDDKKLQGTELLDVPVMGNTDDGELLKLLGKKCEVFVATEDTASRRSLTEMLRTEYEAVPVNAIHQRASVSAHATLGHGNYIGPNAVVAATATLGDGCLLGANAVVEARATVGDFAQLGSGALLGADVQVGELAFIGAGAVVVAGRQNWRQGPRRGRLGGGGRRAQRTNRIWQPGSEGCNSIRIASYELAC
ncbi:MAG: acetyltransferase [Hymenobacter sp.]